MSIWSILKGALIVLEIVSKGKDILDKDSSKKDKLIEFVKKIPDEVLELGKTGDK